MHCKSEHKVYHPPAKQWPMLRSSCFYHRFFRPKSSTVLAPTRCVHTNYIYSGSRLPLHSVATTLEAGARSRVPTLPHLLRFHLAASFSNLGTPGCGRVRREGDRHQLEGEVLPPPSRRCPRLLHLLARGRPNRVPCTRRESRRWLMAARFRLRVSTARSRWWRWQRRRRLRW